MPIKNTCKRFKSGKGKGVGDGRGKLTFYDESKARSGQSTRVTKGKGQNVNKLPGPSSPVEGSVTSRPGDATTL